MGRGGRKTLPIRVDPLEIQFQRGTTRGPERIFSHTTPLECPAEFAQIVRDWTSKAR
jgi:hypothetical protein